MRSPHAPLAGKGCVITITGWLEVLRLRGHTVPNAGRRALAVVSQVIRLNLPLDYPDVKMAGRLDSHAIVKHAPMPPFELMSDFERVATNRSLPEGLRLYASIFTLMSLAPLRLSDLREVQQFRKSDTAACGRSVDQKCKFGTIKPWATPLTGLNGNTGWVQPTLDFWDTQVSKFGQGVLRTLIPAVSDEWDIIDRIGSDGVVRAGLARLGSFVGRDPSLKLHSFRRFIPTCAGQLEFGLSKRRKLGRWSAKSIMPEKYDRATCAAELAVRFRVLNSVAGDWRPAAEFEIPEIPDLKINTAKHEGSDSVNSETSGSSTASKEIDISKLDE